MGVMPQNRQNPVIPLHCVDDLLCQGPRSLEIHVHTKKERGVHYREWDLKNIDLFSGTKVKWPEWMAHAIPEPDAVSITKCCIIFESSIGYIFPRVGNLHSYIVVPVPNNCFFKDTLEARFLVSHLNRIIVRGASSVQSHIPTPVT